MRPAADRAGTTVRAVYSLFGSKDGLVEALAERGYLLLRDKVDAVARTGDPLDDLVRVGIDGFRAFALERPELFRLTFERMPRSVEVSRRTGAAALESYHALADRIERAQAAGLLVDQPTVELVFAFHSLCLGLATSELSREPPPVGMRFWAPVRDIPGEQLWRTALTALIAGFATPSTVPRSAPS